MAEDNTKEDDKKEEESGPSAEDQAKAAKRAEAKDRAKSHMAESKAKSEQASAKRKAETEAASKGSGQSKFITKGRSGGDHKKQYNFSSK